MKRWYILIYIGVVIMSLQLVSSLESYSGNSYTNCKAGFCTSYISANPNYYIYEDKQWKIYKDARSLLGKGYSAYVKLDEKYPLVINDFNFTSISLNFSITNADLGKQIPIQILNDKGEILSTQNLLFASIQPTKLSIPIKFGQTLKYGAKSTTVFITATNITEDGYIQNITPSTLTRYNTSSYMYAGSWGEEFGYVYRAYVEFNNTGIPDSSLISSLIFNMSVSSGTGNPTLLCYAYPIEKQVYLQSNANLYNDIGNGTAYNSTMNCSYYRIGYFAYNLPLAIPDFQNSLTNNWFAIGIRGSDETAFGFAYKSISTVESSDDEELIVSYYIPPTINFVAPTYSSGESLQIYNPITAIFNISMIIDAPMNLSFFNMNGTNYTYFDTGLKAMYNFENKSSLGENATYLKDLSSDTANDGSISGATLVNGKYGKALSFNGISNKVILSTTGLPLGNTPRTIEYWFNAKTFGTGTEYSILTIGTSGAGQVISFNAEDNAVAVVFYSNRWISPKSTLSTDTWYHVAFVIKNGATTTNYTNWTLYIDGVAQTMSLEAGSVQTLNTGSDAFIIGASQASTLFYNGTIDELKIWNYTRTSAEINMSMNSWLYKNSPTQFIWTYPTLLGTGAYNYYSCLRDRINNYICTDYRTLTISMYPQKSGDWTYFDETLPLLYQTVNFTYNFLE